MSVIPIVLRGENTAIEYRLNLATECEVSNFRLNAQTLVGFDDQMCKLVLHRTNLPLIDSLRFDETDIRSGDILTVVPFISESVPSIRGLTQGQALTPNAGYDSRPAASTTLLVAYRLISVIDGVPQGAYAVQLQSVYENQPHRFFEDYSGKERQNLKHFLDDLLGRDTSTAEMDKVIRIWCDDISVGYQQTKVSL